jgi:hypothetical protein
LITLFSKIMPNFCRYISRYVNLQNMKHYIHFIDKVKLILYPQLKISITLPTLGHSMGDMMMMMYFHGGFNEVILFDFWRISTLAGLIGSMVGCFIMGVLYEGIKSYREHWMNGAFHAVNYNQVHN